MVEAGKEVGARRGSLDGQYTLYDSLLTILLVIEAAIDWASAHRYRLDAFADHIFLSDTSPSGCCTVSTQYHVCKIERLSTVLSRLADTFDSCCCLTVRVGLGACEVELETVLHREGVRSSRRRASIATTSICSSATMGEDAATAPYMRASTSSGTSNERELHAVNQQF